MPPDSIMLSIIQSGLTHIANEMDLVQEKGSFSPVISEAFDRANGIYRRGSGDVVVQGVRGLPAFIGVMQETTRAVIERRRDLEPGDIIIVNDPYLGGTHLMDVKLVMPFFYRGKLWCFLANSGHWPDTGGMVPGGFATTATEIQQEGLRLPPVKLYRRGELDQDIVDIILSNIRVPEERIGDLKAQVGALHVGVRSLTAFLDRYGADEVDTVIDELARRSEIQTRAAIEEIPDGVYEFSGELDSDGIDNRPLTIDLKMTVSGSEIEFDFSRSSPPCRGPLNSVWATTTTAVYIALKHIFPEIPINAGCFRPIRIPKPIGTFLYAEYPRPVSGCAAETSQRIFEVVFGAMGRALPDRVPAALFSTSGNLCLGGTDPRYDRNYVLVNFSGGGYGASAGSDGLSNGNAATSTSKTQPIEILEQRYPVLFETYALAEHSGGAGRQRGGLGVHYRLRLLHGSGRASFLMEHGRTGPHGLGGGLPGGCTAIRVIRGGHAESLPHLTKASDLELSEGDVIEVTTPGGGGYGDPHARDPAAVGRDVELGYISADEAQRIYGRRV